MALFHVFQHWQDIVPGETSPVQYSQVESEELESHHVMWLQHHEFLEQLELEFNLGEFGYVKGDRNKFQEVQAALNRKKMEYIGQGKDDEAKKIRSLLWPYRDTLRDHDVIPSLVLHPLKDNYVCWQGQ